MRNTYFWTVIYSYSGLQSFNGIEFGKKNT